MHPIDQVALAFDPTSLQVLNLILGLILFGTQAYLQTPLTFDRNTVRTLLTETPLGIAGGKTAIGDAIGLAVKRLQARQGAGVTS